MKKGRICSLLVGLTLCVVLFSAHRVHADDTYQLRLSSFVPPMHFMNTKVLEPWIEKLEEETGGRLKIKVYAGGALGKPADQYDMAVRGAADITWGILAYTPGRFPLTTVMELPFMSPSAEAGSRMVQRLLDQGYFQDEFKGVKMLALGMPPNMDIHTNARLVKTLEDLKGMRIRTPSAMMGELIKKWGGVPVAMPLAEVYMSLERGVMDAVFLDPLSMMGIKVDEVTKYHTRVQISSTVFFFAMNKKSWDRLPPDIQEVVDTYSGEYLAAELNGKIADATVVKVIEKLKASGDEVYELPQEEKARWEKSAETAYDEWLDSMQDKGLPGKEVLDAALRLKTEVTE